MTKLRLVQEADIDELVAMGQSMIAESSFSPMGYAPQRVSDFIRRTMAQGLACASVEGEEITGVLLGDVVQPWYSEHRMGVEHVLYVRPQYQGTRAALMLIKAWAKWSLDSGAIQLRPGTSAGSAAADRLYAAMGFEKTGSLYVMNRS